MTRPSRLRQILRLVYWTLTFQLPARIREKRTVAAIWASGLFDSGYYLETYGDVVASSLDPVTHYVRHGWREGRNPSAVFDTRYYLAANPDVEASGRNPLEHFIHSGAGECRSPNAELDLAGYVGANPFIAESGINPLLHYIEVGPQGPRRSSARPLQGSIDDASSWGVRGWLRNPEAPERPVVADVFANDSLVATVLANRFRGDLEGRLAGDGYWGFVWDAPPVFAETRGQEIVVRPRGGAASVRNNGVRVSSLVRAQDPPWRRAPAPLVSYSQALPVRRAREPEPQPSIELIVLNLNGSHWLERFLESFAEYNRWPRAQVTIVDHGSTDESAAVVERYANRVEIHMEARGENYSFSASNNYAATRSKADIVVFANNDLRFRSDPLARVANLLDDPGIAIVGSKLVDRSPAGDSTIAIQHLGIGFDRFRRPRQDGADAVPTPFEVRGVAGTETWDGRIVETPAVTGAFLAMRREDFLSLGGFDEDYFYGYEDVDLCLRARLGGAGKVVCANDLSIEHDRAGTRGRPNPELAARHRSNRERFASRWGYPLRRSMRRDLGDRPGFWGLTPTRIGFAVSDASEETRAGDVFTAFELARALERNAGVECVILPRTQDWYEAGGLDVLVSMVVGYDPHQIRDAAPHLLRIAWVRNWFEEFAADPNAGGFDLVWGASERAAAYLGEALSKPVSLMRIATAFDRFSGGAFDPSLASDYVFTGHYWSDHRDVIDMLGHRALPYQGKIFGGGWEQVDALRELSQGPLPYSRMPDVYASTRIVIDDANRTTKPWGSVNSRVYDAIAAGALVVSNGQAGSEEVFDGLLPTFSDGAELSELLTRFLEDDALRRRTVAELRARVADEHSYERRAQEAWGQIRAAFSEQLRVAIKIATPREAGREEWGDYHYAVALKRALDAIGWSARIDTRDQWERPESAGDDVVLVLRGLEAYTPREDQINLMWMISHPDRVPDPEAEAFDHVFVASQTYAEALGRRLSTPVEALLQCTDPGRFFPDAAADRPRRREGVVFVGNSRKVFRKAVRDALEADIPIRVYGTNWEGLIPDHVIAGQHIENEHLREVYSGATAVLNDHWDSMRERGFLSNRLFDAVASGARVISDPVAGLDEVFGDRVWTYDTPDELRDLVGRAEQEDGGVGLEAAEAVRTRHGFAQRAARIATVVRALDAVRREGVPHG